VPDYDYVIVGAGSAGCTLANRLSADPSVRVLLLEAGRRDRSLFIKAPLAFSKQFHTHLDWDYWTDPEPALAGRSLYIPRGKSLGGSSSMNAMLYVRGRPLDYDGWEAQGAPGWGYQDVLPYFMRAEGNARGAADWRGDSGPLHVSDQRTPTPLSRRILDASVQAGIPYNPDYNGPEQDGVALFQVTQFGGKRWSTADAYLRPALQRPNLDVRTHVLAAGLELDGTRVSGVRIRRGRRGIETIRAAREVILCAGAIGSPQQLQLSGIGAPDELRAAGIDCRHELPGVGGNLQDHPFVAVQYAVSDRHSLDNADKSLAAAVEWLGRGSGRLSSPGAEVCAFTRSRPGLPAADLQFHMAPILFEDHGAVQVRIGRHAVSLAPVLVTPQARGRVWVRSDRPTDKPHILTNTLAEPEDIAALVAGIKLARQIASEPALAEIITEELRPGRSILDDDELEVSLRERVELLYHPCGTCRMSDTDEEAVVDSQLRVHGLEGIRVVDASVMPVIPRGNTNAPTIMIAEKAADLIAGREPAARVRVAA
jgi:choline dehydrogenase